MADRRDAPSNVARSDRVVEALREAVRLCGAGREDEALALLQSLKPDVSALRAASRVTHDLVKAESDYAQEQLHATLESLAGARETAGKLRVLAAQLQANRADAQAALAETQKALYAMMKEIADEQERMRQMREDMSDGGLGLLIPGYNIYLIGQAMFDGTPGRIESLQDSIRSLREEMPDLQLELEERQAMLGSVAGQICALAMTEGELTLRMGQLEQAQKGLSASVATSSAVTFFLADLDVSLQDVEDDLESTYRLAERLSDPVEVVQGHELRQGTLDEALHDFAFFADTATTPVEVFRNMADGPTPIPYTLGVQSDARIDSFVFVGFTVETFTHLQKIVMPIEGTDLVVQLGTGPALPDSSEMQPVAEAPTILVSVPLPGRTRPGEHEIAMPGLQVLAPGRQYFILLTAAKLEAEAGRWLAAWPPKEDYLGWQYTPQGRLVFQGWQDPAMESTASAETQFYGWQTPARGTSGRARTQYYGRKEVPRMRGYTPAWYLLDSGKAVPKLIVYGTPLIGVLPAEHEIEIAAPIYA